MANNGHMVGVPWFCEVLCDEALGFVEHVRRQIRNWATSGHDLVTKWLSMGLTLRFWAIHSCESCLFLLLGLILSMQINCEDAARMMMRRAKDLRAIGTVGESSTLRLISQGQMTIKQRCFHFVLILILSKVSSTTKNYRATWSCTEDNSWKAVNSFPGMVA